MKHSYLVLVFALLSALVHADNKPLRDHVLASLAKQPQKHFYFVQEKKLAMLDKPLVTEGELLLSDNQQDKNHTVTWDIQKPYALRYVLTRDTIREIDAQGERTLQVGQNPIAAALTQAMTATFSGQWKDTDTLASIAATGTAADWQLQVTPLSAELQPLIKTIAVAGSEGIISTVVISESNGDSTTIHLKTLPSP
jgi:hypothetical protein